ncbi:hypothetical protein FB451DRAFT_1470908 [Mycena latifolia]|nr:hypothetical protein FB451DRAFT_1470908 [Mycena latifolia]
MRHPSARADPRRLVGRLRGDVTTWLRDESGAFLPHGGATVLGNQISATYRLPAASRFRVYWRSHRRPMTAVCALVRPPLPGQTEEHVASIHVMDKTMPVSQFQSSETPFNSRLIEGWFSSPPAGESSFLRLDIYGATQEATLDGYDYRSEEELGRPTVILKFNLVGLPPASAALAQFTRSSCPSPEPVIVEDAARGTVRRQTVRNNRGNVTRQRSVIDLLMAAARAAHDDDDELTTACWMPVRFRRKLGERWVGKKGPRRQH